MLLGCIRNTTPPLCTNIIMVICTIRFFSFFFIRKVKRNCAIDIKDKIPKVKEKIHVGETGNVTLG